MARIYVNPTITLAASVSTSAQEGLFQSADFGKFGQPLSTPCDIHVRKPLRHRATDLPLLERGWVFQEHLLSPRILHFGHDELMWECMEFTSWECGGMEEEHSAFQESWLALRNASNPIHRRLHKEDRWELCKIWSTLVEEYSRLKLSKPSDIFPAISGIAKSFGEAIGWKYCAGMWKETMIHELLWYVQMPATWCVPWWAPIFSWASVTTTFGIHPDDYNDCNMLATVIRVRCCPTGDDPIGLLKSGWIILSGTLIHAIFRHPCLNFRHGIKTLPSNGGRVFRFRFVGDFDLKQPGHEVNDGETVFCLEVVEKERSGDYKAVYLVLSKKGHAIMGVGRHEERLRV